MNEQMLPISKAAEIMHTTELNVLMHIKRGHLKGIETDGAWMIDGVSLEELLATTGGLKVNDICGSGCDKKHACGGGCS